MQTSSEQPGPPEPQSAAEESHTNVTRTDLADVVKLAETLKPNERTRLIAQLFEGLPPKNRAAVVAFVLENLRSPTDNFARPLDLPRVNPIYSKLWEILFDPAKTSELYSAPRRFDLATIFVVTAAYSLLFGAMTALDYYFGAPAKVAVGLLVTLIAVSQAYFQHIANPRGVSIVAGSISLSFILMAMKLIHRDWIQEPLVVVVVVYGMIGGAVAGYLSGVLVGGVFLVADALRKSFTRRASQPGQNRDTPHSDSANPSESPWTN